MCVCVCVFHCLVKMVHGRLERVSAIDILRIFVLKPENLCTYVYSDRLHNDCSTNFINYLFYFDIE